MFENPEFDFSSILAISPFLTILGDCQGKLHLISIDLCHFFAFCRFSSIYVDFHRNMSIFFELCRFSSNYVVIDLCRLSSTYVNFHRIMDFLRILSIFIHLCRFSYFSISIDFRRLFLKFLSIFVYS